MKLKSTMQTVYATGLHNVERRIDPHTTDVYLYVKVPTPRKRGHQYHIQLVRKDNLIFEQGK